MKKIFIILLIGIAGLVYAPINEVHAQSCDVTLTVTTDYWYYEGYYIVYDNAFNVVLGWQTFNYSWQTKTHTLPGLTDGAQYLVIVYDTYGDGGISGSVTTAAGVLLTSWSGYSYSTYGYNYFINGCAASGPANDDCAGAEPISCGQSISGSTSTAAPDYASFCGTSNTAPGVWYTFAGDGSCVTLSTCNAGTSYDTKLTVYEGTCGSLTCVAGNDDDFSCGNSIFNSTVNFKTNVGSEYWVLVHGWSSNTGDFELSMSCSAPPGNDDVCNVWGLSVGTFNNPIFYWADNRCASAQPGEVSPGAGSTPGFTCNSQDGWCSFETGVQNSVWYAFRAPASGCANIAAGSFLNSSPVDWQLAVWDVGNCGDFSTFTEMAANDDLGPGFSPWIYELACLTPGKWYYIQLDGYAGTEGLDAITVWDCGNAPLEAVVSGCATVYEGYDLASNCAVLSASGTGGFPPYTYSWSNGSTNEDITVCPSATTTYTLTVTDNYGCVATQDWTVEVLDITCGGHSHSSSHSSSHSGSGSGSGSGSFAGAINAKGGSSSHSGSGSHVPSCPSSSHSSHSHSSSGSGSGSFAGAVNAKGGSSSGSGSGSGSHSSHSHSSSGSPFEACSASGSGSLRSACHSHSGSGSGSGSSSGSGSHGGPTGVLMCFEGDTYCVNFKQVSKKLACGFTLGPCDAQQSAACDNSVSSTDVALNCVCSGKLASIVVKYVGADGQDFNVNSKKCKGLIASVTGANTGDEFTIDASAGGLNYFKNHTYFELLGSSYGSIKIPTNCHCNAQSQRYFPFEIVGWTDTDGNECSATPPCEDLSVTITLDLFPTETSFQLENTTTGTILLDVPTYSYSGMANQTVVESAGCQSVDDCYELRIADSFGDGICCFWGAGDYSVSLGSTVVGSPTGGAFGSSETVEIGNCGAYQANSNQKLAAAGMPDKAESKTLAQLSAYPNPLEDVAHFEFSIPETGSVSLEVLNLKGDIVGTLHSGTAEGGHNYKVTFDASDLSSGIYFVQLTTPAEFLKEKLIIIK